MPRNIELKIKIKSLADETRTIKSEERKLKADGKGPGAQFNSIYRHRMDVVRPESRHSLLAYGYLRGRSYKQMEEKCRQDPNWKHVKRLIERFGGNPANFDAWKKGLPFQVEEAA